MRTEFKDIDEYIGSFATSTQKILQKVRAVIRKCAPEAQETIKYAIPTFELHGNLVHFAAFSKHVGFYPGANGISTFKKQLAPYKGAKGSVQFPLDKPIPFDIISDIVKFRVEENMRKVLAKKTLRRCKNGHTFHKTSECPTCPICESQKKPASEWMSEFAAPARRALDAAGVIAISNFTKYTEEEISNLHGMGPKSIATIKRILRSNKLDFKKK